MCCACIAASLLCGLKRFSPTVVLSMIALTTRRFACLLAGESTAGENLKREREVWHGVASILSTPVMLKLSLWAARLPASEPVSGQPASGHCSLQDDSASRCRCVWRLSAPLSSDAQSSSPPGLLEAYSGSAAAGSMPHLHAAVPAAAAPRCPS